MTPISLELYSLPEPPVLRSPGVRIKCSRVGRLTYARPSNSKRKAEPTMDTERIVGDVFHALLESDLGRFLQKLKDEVDRSGDGDEEEEEPGFYGSDDDTGDYDMEDEGLEHEPESEFHMPYSEAPASSRQRYSRRSGLGGEDPTAKQLRQLGDLGPNAFTEALAAQDARIRWENRRMNGDV